MALAQHAELPEEQHMGMGVNNAAREGKNQGLAQHAESSEGNAKPFVDIAELLEGIAALNLYPAATP